MTPYQKPKRPKMQLLALGLVAALGMSGCAKPKINAGHCAVMHQPVSALSTEALKHPNAPSALGEAIVDVVVSHQSVC